MGKLSFFILAVVYVIHIVFIFDEMDRLWGGVLVKVVYVVESCEYIVLAYVEPVRVWPIYV